MLHVPMQKNTIPLKKGNGWNAQSYTFKSRTLGSVGRVTDPDTFSEYYVENYTSLIGQSNIKMYLETVCNPASQPRFLSIARWGNKRPSCIKTKTDGSPYL